MDLAARSGITARSSCAWLRRCRCWPCAPNQSTSVASPSLRRSPTVRMPRASRRSRVRGPTPHSAPIGSGARNSSSLPNGDLGEPVRLVHAAGDLGEELHARDADRAGQARLGEHGGADRLGGGSRGAPQSLGAGEVDEGLVDRQAFHQRREALEDLEDLGRDRRVSVVARRNDDRLRAQSQRLAHRLRRVTAVLSRLVAGGRDDAAVAGAADQHRLAAQLGRVTHLDRREEGVHVDVQDRALRRHSGKRSIAAPAGRCEPIFEAREVTGEPGVARRSLFAGGMAPPVECAG